MRLRMSGHTSQSLTEGPVVRNLITFTIPLFLGQLLQQLYNVADAWVIGNFSNNDAFAAVSSTGTIVFLIIGFFAGLGTGGSVLISRYFGAHEEETLSKAIHTHFLVGIIASVISTAAGLLLNKPLLMLLGTPDSVMPYAQQYLGIFFAGVSTSIMYNVSMAIMRAVGDSLHPLYYLIFSSFLNIGLDLLFVAHPSFRWGIVGAALATVLSQGVSAILCIRHLLRMPKELRLDFRKLKLYPDLMKLVIALGLPSGLQNAVITIGNLTVQKNINSFGPFAMAGQGAYSKIEGFVFLPIMSLSLSVPTFISQNLGAQQYERAKKGAWFGVISAVVLAESIGILFYLLAPTLISFFVSEPESVRFGASYARVTSLFYCLLAFAHATAGVMRGCGKAVVPMANMLIFWCAVRIVYVTMILRFIPQFQMIAWAYPLTWGLSDIVFAFFLFKSDWVHNFEKKAI